MQKFTIIISDEQRKLLIDALNEDLPMLLSELKEEADLLRGMLEDQLTTDPSTVHDFTA